MIGKAVISRFNREKNSAWDECFEYSYTPGMSVLDVLNRAREMDPSLCFEVSCRSGKCGLCALEVNGRPCLACETPAEPELHIAPLRAFTTVRDLCFDRSAVREKLGALKPYLVRGDTAECPDATASDENDGLFERSRRCIECFCCMDVCPVLRKKTPDFAGPAILVRISRYYFDPRDSFDRKDQLIQNGIESCVNCSLCSKVCPEELDPAGLIKRLKNIII